MAMVIWQYGNMQYNDGDMVIVIYNGDMPI